MTITDNYYEWLMEMMPGLRESYSRLLRMLFDTPFVAEMSQDRNRISDGLELRNRFRISTGALRFINPEDRIELADKPCGVLEVMISMALRCEEEYMSLGSDGDNVERWIRWMIRSMELEWADDTRFEPGKAEHAILAMIYREYEMDGQGGLFFVPGFHGNMREIELWDQLMIWIEFVNSDGGI